MALVAAAASAQSDSDSSVTYQATAESIQSHEVPDWFHDAKFGIFVHWTMSCVPAFAPQLGDLNYIFGQRPNEALKLLPYGEWYENAMKFPDSPTARYHAENYGADTPYENFRMPFERTLDSWDPTQLVDLIAASGARYVVWVTKHHDGYCMWPTKVSNPAKPDWHYEGTFLDAFAAAVRDRGMKFGVYYSGGLDWSINPEPIEGILDAYPSVPASEAYRAYVLAHYKELIERYRPDVLWNDIAYPPGPEFVELIAHYYNTVPGGVINDRWFQPPKEKIEAGERIMPGPPIHSDFTTPEYRQFAQIVPKKWEMTRGISNSFGYVRNEDPEDVIKPDELIRMFVDAVSKNGNLLLNIGPREDGTVVPSHEIPLRAMGEWLSRNGEAIYGTRPWTRPEGEATIDGGDAIPVRFTRNGKSLYAIVLGTPGGKRITLSGLGREAFADVSLLGGTVEEWGIDGDDLTVVLSEIPSDPYATVLALTLE